MNTNSIYNVKSSSYLDTFFLLINIEESKEILFDCIASDLVSTDCQYFIIVINSKNYWHLTDFLKRQKIQLRVSYVEFYEQSTYDLIPPAFFHTYGQDNEPSELEIGCDLNNKSIFNYK